MAGDGCSVDPFPAYTEMNGVGIKNIRCNWRVKRAYLVVSMRIFYANARKLNTRSHLLTENALHLF